MQGTIKTKLNGFGFIKREGQDKDLFFHASNLVGISFEELKEGQVVTFEEEQGQKGPAAVNVRCA